MWHRAEPAEGTPADLYLTWRGLPGLAASPALRFGVSTQHPEGGRYPALIALISDSANQPIAMHRTFITLEGRKANIPTVRASLGAMWGGAIRLHDLDPTHPLVVGEGIETTASAGIKMGFRAWAAVSAGNLGKGLVLPPEARRVMIAMDPGEPGRDAARDAWFRWRSEGRHVRIAVPDGPGDFNDLLTAREAGHVA
jgi:putative DNA primase/helicase